MQTIEEPVETIHLYVVREQPKKPYTLLPLLAAALCLLSMAAVTLYSAEHPYYIRERLAVPAISLAPRVFTAEAPIIATGIKTYPATTAYGTLTLTNGSALSEVLPVGMIFSGNGAEVQTTASAFIPAGNANGYGVATVPAKAITAGQSGNIPTLAINAVYGTALYVRNLSAFSGGRDGYSVSYATAQDKQTAYSTARNLLAMIIRSGYHFPCSEIVNNQSAIIKLIVNCQFVTYRVPSYMHVLTAKLSGKQFLIEVAFLPRPVQVWVR